MANITAPSPLPQLEMSALQRWTKKMNVETIEISEVVKKLPETRTTEELEKILPYLTSRSELLNNLKHDVLFELIKHCRLQKCKKNELIIKQGAIGDCFYVILTGQVSVYIDTSKSDDSFDESVTIEKRNELETFFEELDVLLGLTPKGSSAENEQEQFERSALGKFIMVIESGKSFGEVALLSDNSERNASIVADMDNMDLLVVDKELYDRTIKERQLAEYKDKRNFICQHHLFKTWGSKLQRLLEMSMVKTCFSFDNVVVQQGASYDGLYFIISGQAKLVVDPVKHHSQFPRHMPTTGGVRKRQLAQNIVHVKRKYGYAEAEKVFNHKLVDLAYLSDGDVFGDLESVTQMPAYLGTLRCMSELVVLHINAKNLDRLIVKKNPRTYEQLRDVTFHRYTDLMRTKAGEMVPLLKAVYEKHIRPEEVVEQPAKSKSKEKSDFQTAHLLELFTEGKMQLFEPCVPDTVYYKCKSIDRRKHDLSARERILKEQRDNSVSGKLRSLHETRKKALSGNGRRARSRRELNSLTLNDFPSTPKVVLKYNEYGTTENLEEEQLATDTNHRPRPATTIGHRAQSAIIQPAERRAHSQRPHTTKGLSQGHPRSDERKGSMSSGKIERVSSWRSAAGPEPDEDLIADFGDYPLVAFFNVMQVIERRRGMLTGRWRPESAPDPLQRLLADAKAAGNNDAPVDQSEASNDMLTSLEQRLNNFHMKLLKDNRSEKPVVTQMKRCELQGTDPPVAGGTVYVKVKPCSVQRSVGEETDEHSHVKRYILPRLKSY